MQEFRRADSKGAIVSRTAMTKLIGFLAIAASLPSLRANKGPTDSLADRADAVVVAEVQSGLHAGPSLAVVLSVVRAIKGNLAAGATINVSADAGGNIGGTGGIRGGWYGLWFLKRADGQWTALPSLEELLHSPPYIPLPNTSSPPAVPLASPPVTISDHIAVELAAALLSHRSYATPFQLVILGWALLGIGDSALVPGLYRTLRTNSDPELRFIGVRGLLRGNEGASALAEIANNLDVVTKLHTGSFVVTAICGQRNPDPGAIQSLGKIASSSDANVQRCAAEALMYIHTRETLPFLAQLLDSSDPRTREEAIRGLSRFVDNLPITTQYNTINAKALIPQGPAPYRTAETDRYSLSTRSLGQADQTEHLRFWRSWWATMRDKVMPRPPA